MLAYTIGAMEIILVLVVLLLLFGARKLPELARSLGRSSKEFKEGLREGGDPEADEDAEPRSKSKLPPD